MLKYFLSFALILNFSLSPSARAETDPNRIAEAFEGVYDLVFDCEASHQCPDETGTLKNLVILGTSKPTILGSGLGWLVTIVNPVVGPAFSFSGASYDALTNTIHATSAGGYSGQIADLTLTLDPVSGQIKGLLDDSLSAGHLMFVARPVRTVGTFFTSDGDPTPLAGIEGLYSGKWAGYPSELLLKDFGLSGLAGRLIMTGPSPLPFPFHGGLLYESRGFMTLVGGGFGATLKLFAVSQGGQWKGYTVSSRFGTIAELGLKRVSP